MQRPQRPQIGAQPSDLTARLAALMGTQGPVSGTMAQAGMADIEAEMADIEEPVRAQGDLVAPALAQGKIKKIGRIFSAYDQLPNDEKQQRKLDMGWEVIDDITPETLIQFYTENPGKIDGVLAHAEMGAAA